jgi:Protein of unknown function (DUF2815)
MTAEKHEATTVVLGKTPGKLVRFSYLHVFRPHLNKESGRSEYSVQIMIPKANTEDVAAIKAAIAEQEKILWPKGNLPPKYQYPLKDGDTHKSQKGEDRSVPGHWLLTSKTDAYPRVKGSNDEDKTAPVNPPPEVAGTTRGTELGPNGKPKLELLTESQVKSGDWGRVSVNVKSYTTGNTGTSAFLNSLQKVQTGEPLGNGRRSAASEFDDYDDTDESDDPLA